jgi:hypothetical protein
MKNKLFMLGAILLFILVFSSINSTAQNLEVAKNTDMEINKDSNNDATITGIITDDLQKYISEKQEDIAFIENILVEYSDLIKTKQHEVTENDLKKLEDLEQKNKDLKMRLINFKSEGNANADAFKQTFDRSMEDLKTEIETLTGIRSK